MAPSSGSRGGGAGADHLKKYSHAYLAASLLKRITLHIPYSNILCPLPAHFTAHARNQGPSAQGQRTGTQGFGARPNKSAGSLSPSLSFSLSLSLIYIYIYRHARFFRVCVYTSLSLSLYNLYMGGSQN